MKKHRQSQASSRDLASLPKPLQRRGLEGLNTRDPGFCGSKIPFTKMHALGNDFILIENKHLKTKLTPKQVRVLANRRHGIGCDQVIVLQEPKGVDADIFFYNADGKQALACGNGTRCVAKHLSKKKGLIQTPTFLSQFWNRKDKITISLRDPHFAPSMPLPLSLSKGYCIDVGNPHVVIFTEDLTSIDLEGLALSLQPPQGINVEIAQVISPTTVKVRVWERGVGITPACGSGACAVGILSLKLDLIKKTPVFIEMEGGVLEVDWSTGAPLLLTGAAHYCFEGMIDLP